jgi:F-type H+-transporting ATPase subunit delta
VIKSSVARRYAKALFELLDATSVAPARAGLIGLGETFSASSQLKHVLASPAFGAEDKQAVLSALSRKLGCPPVVDRFLAQLVKKNRTGFLPEIADAFAELADRARGAARVSVASAKPLSEAEQNGLRQRLKELLKQDVDLTFQTEPGLLAGLQLRIGSTVYDSTVRTRLTAMQTVLTKE